MAWYPKEQPTPFDHAPIEGLFFQSGVLTDQPETHRHKQPQLAFPSGECFPLTLTPDDIPHLILYHGLYLPLFDSIESAYEQACWQSSNAWFNVFRQADRLEIWSDQGEAVFFITYDQTTGRIADIEMGAG